MVSGNNGSKLLALISMLTCTACGQANQQEQAEMQATGKSDTVLEAGKAADSATPIPPELERIIAERRKACDGKVGQQFGRTLTADFNADGKTDYILSQENFLCADELAGPETWGIAGPGYEFLVSTSNGYKLDDGFSQRFGIDIKKRPTGDVIQLEQENNSSEGCNGQFTITWSWTGKKMDVTDRRNARGQKVDEQGCAASASGALPIKLGYYGHAGETCAVAMKSYTNGITIDDKYWGDIDGDYPLRPVRKLGNGQYQLGESYIIEVTGADRFTAWVAGSGGRAELDTERRFVWCAAKAPQ